MSEAEKLIKMAREARKMSYSPYSRFAVGAALLCGSGKVYTGCNIENGAFSPTCCAERVAIFKAVSEGEMELEAIAVAGGKAGEHADARCYPCGVCRQVLGEFCDSDMKVYFSDGSSTTVGELLPMAFDLK